MCYFFGKSCVCQNSIFDELTILEKNKNKKYILGCNLPLRYILSPIITHLESFKYKPGVPKFSSRKEKAYLNEANFRDGFQKRAS